MAQLQSTLEQLQEQRVRLRIRNALLEGFVQQRDLGIHKVCSKAGELSVLRVGYWVVSVALAGGRLSPSLGGERVMEGLTLSVAICIG